MTIVNKQPLYLALQYYAKHYVDYSALITAIDNGNYEKALTRLAIEFSRNVPYKSKYGVDRSEIIRLLDDYIIEFGACNYIDASEKAFAYVGGSSRLRVVFANSKADVQRKLADLPSFMYSEMPPRSTKLIYQVEKFVTGGVIINGEFTAFDDSPLTTFVNVSGRTSYREVDAEVVAND